MRMTGLLPYVQLGKRSDLGSAVAELTGLRPLRDFVKHANKSYEKLRGDLPKERGKEIASLDGEYASECEELGDSSRTRGYCSGRPVTARSSGRGVRT